MTAGRGRIQRRKSQDMANGLAPLYLQNTLAGAAAHMLAAGMLGDRSILLRVIRRRVGTGKVLLQRTFRVCAATMRAPALRPGLVQHYHLPAHRTVFHRRIVHDAPFPARHKVEKCCLAALSILDLRIPVNDDVRALAQVFGQ
jgi:hypothetical protein